MNRYTNLPAKVNISQSFKEIDTGFDRVQQDMDQVQGLADENSRRISDIIAHPGEGKDSELVDIRTPAAGYVPDEPIIVAGDLTRDMQRKIVAVDQQVDGLPELVDDLAGEGRTDETVKGNADALAAHKADYMQYLDKYNPLGFWEDVEPGVNMWRFGDRILLGSAIEQDGNYIPTKRSPISSKWYMLYFDSRSQLEVGSTIGGVAIAAASFSNDNDRVGENATIGVASFVDNDNTNASDKKSAWAYYGHAVQSEPNNFTCGIEIGIADISGAPMRISTPYNMGGTNAAWFAAGGEVLQTAGHTATSYVNSAISIATSMPSDPLSKFDKGIVFGADAIAGTNGIAGTGIAMEMAKGHELVWRFSNSPNAYGAKIRSDVSGAHLQTRIIFENSGFFVKGVAEDLETEVNLFQILTLKDAVNYVALSPNASGGGVGVIASGADANVDLRLQPKGNGMLNYIKNAVAASAPNNFSATHHIPIKANGVTYYIPVQASTW